MSKPVTPQDFPEIRWKGNWVWVPDEALSPTSMFSFGTGGQKKEAHALFRKTFDLERVPARAPARVTADSRYVYSSTGRKSIVAPSAANHGVCIMTCSTWPLI